MTCTMCQRWIEEGEAAYIIKEVLIVGDHEYESDNPLDHEALYCTSCAKFPIKDPE